MHQVAPFQASMYSRTARWKPAPLNSGVNDRRGRGFLLARFSIGSILSGAAILSTAIGTGRSLLDVGLREARMVERSDDSAEALRLTAGRTSHIAKSYKRR